MIFILTILSIYAVLGAILVKDFIDYGKRPTQNSAPKNLPYREPATVPIQDRPEVPKIKKVNTMTKTQWNALCVGLCAVVVSALLITEGALFNLMSDPLKAFSVTALLVLSVGTVVCSCIFWRP